VSRFRSALLLRVLRIAVSLASRDWWVSRRFRRVFWNRLYDDSSGDFLPREIMGFVNLGYLEEPGSSDGTDGADLGDRLSERLYDRLVAGVRFEGKQVLEVGCGPGAGSAHLARAHRSASFTGVDLNEGMVAWGREHHREPNLRFAQGDALDLPLDAASVDVVLNLESSHCYPSRQRFFDEVARVLRPGGSFLIGDIVVDASGEDADDVSAQLENAGLTVEGRTDITKNVVWSRDAASRASAFRAHIAEKVEPHRVPLVEGMLCLRDTPGYEDLVNGRMEYMLWRAFKPGGDPGSGGDAELEESIQA
jgi:SAM-dependent methyltransferase